MQDRPNYRERAFQCVGGHSFKHFMWSYEPLPACPECSAEVAPEFATGKSACVIQDTIEGGVEIRHGICNEDGTPRRYYSHSEMRAEAKRRGLINLVEHVPLRGSDKNPHTTRWV